MIALKFVYIANIIVAGWISITSLLFPAKAQETIFSNDFDYSEAMRLIGALWGAVFALSTVGLFYPQKMNLVFVFHLIYKPSWLLFVAMTALIIQTILSERNGYVFYCVGDCFTIRSSTDELFENQ